MIVRGIVRRSAYHDSVTLMRAQQALRGYPGIDEAGVVMATEANLDLLKQAGLDLGGAAATADDLAVVIRGDTEDHVRAALDALDELLRPRGTHAAALDAYRPRTMRVAVRMLPGADLALISIPGRFAAGVAREALAEGLHVMVFSDNVPIEEEVRLKSIGGAAGRLVMGPDCGTALLRGAALGFANRVRRGPVGLVGASGTGLQEVASLIHRFGGGISHAIGTGSRDLARAVDGATMRAGLALLAGDPSTTAIVLVSKPPDPQVGGRLLAQAAAAGKPVVCAFVGMTEGRGAPGVYEASSLEDAARAAVRLGGGAPRTTETESRIWAANAARRARTVIGRLAPSQRYLRGLYSGGTLCAEGVALLGAILQPLFTNVPAGQTEPHRGVGPSHGHTMLDLGDDLFTVGRLHPMLDASLRTLRLGQEAADQEVAVLLLDVVLGEGVPADPAGDLVPAISAAVTAAAESGRHLAVVASVCGTDEDPQNRGRQVNRLEAAGVLVEDSNIRAAALAGLIASRAADIPAAFVKAVDSGARPSAAEYANVEITPPERSRQLLEAPLRVINAGLEVFAESLRAQQIEVVNLDWRPPAGGDRAMMDLLERLG